MYHTMNTTLHGQKSVSLHFTANDISHMMEHFGEKRQNFGSNLNRGKYHPNIRYNKIHPLTVNVRHSQI